LILNKYIKLNLLPQKPQLVIHKVKLENPEVEIPEVKLYDLTGENFQNTPFSYVDIYTSEVKEVSLVYNIVYT
jgi:hypothetical protein